MLAIGYNPAETERAEFQNTFSGIDIKRAMQGAMGDSLALARLLPKLFTVLNRSYRVLKKHVEKGDVNGSVKIARFIGKSSRNFGVIYLSKTATQMEQAIRSGAPNFIEECTVSMGMAIDGFEKEVNRLCPKV
jgi:HPt (histidine-containing phosphotransfer) domain-containing protein